MSWADLKDLALSSTMDAFGSAATYTPKVGTPYSINAIFRDTFVEVRGRDSIGNASLRPTLTVRLADLLAEPGEGDAVTVNAVAYNIIEAQSDGGGGSVLILQKQ